ncbi:SDR family NAD(P)-dependent oxidoreductase [Algihabitans albus]|uniref:SDR family NAD(P)-dependent oxidoreductase n=1 Tax=Algihabitans albus TaxID=2164067 RepID=UPI000E5C9F8B|nr:SDR family NAD(P)-dependent oxidoreductase [Algihabitans albus]
MTEGSARRFAGQVAVVTGASRGLGRALALGLGREGAQVLACATDRSVGALEDLDDAIQKAGGPRPTLVPFDLKDGERIDALPSALAQRHGRLDLLIGNAAVLGGLSPLGHVDSRAWRDTFAVNLDANQRLLARLDPLLRQSKGTALFISCRVAAEAPAYWSAYAASKAALERMAAVYAKEVEKFEVTVGCIAPGPLRTRLRVQAFPGEDPESVAKPEEAATEILEQLADGTLGRPQESSAALPL